MVVMANPAELTAPETSRYPKSKQGSQGRDDAVVGDVCHAGGTRRATASTNFRMTPTTFSRAVTGDGTIARKPTLTAATKNTIGTRAGGFLVSLADDIASRSNSLPRISQS